MRLTSDQMRRELDFIEAAETLLKNRRAGIEAEAEGRMMKNEHIPGWLLEDVKGHRKFTVGADIVQQKTGIYPFKTVQMTPAEIERAGANKAIVKDITRSPTTGRRLARATGKTFERIFKK